MSGTDRTRAVAIVLEPDVLADLRTCATRRSVTLASVVLRAIEVNAESLRTHWAPLPGEAARGGLFQGTSASYRREQPGVQAQIRLVESDAAILDQLVVDWGAPSRSALVNEALLKFLGDEETLNVYLKAPTRH